MSRLEFGPDTSQVEITDLKKGLGVFRPKPGKAVSLTQLANALKDIGYKLADAIITLSGTLERSGEDWIVRSSDAKQLFILRGDKVREVAERIGAGKGVRLRGKWQAEFNGSEQREIIINAEVEAIPGLPPAEPPAASAALPAPIFATPIRTTSPGTIVYRGGAVVPRWNLIKQSLGDLDVSWNILKFGLAYSPTPRTLVEAEIPYVHTSFRSGSISGSASGLGNIIVWGKYRFYRTLAEWGDRHASARFGLEFPTSANNHFLNSGLPAAVRRQMQPGSGGVSPHLELSYSSGVKRFVYGGSVEQIIRTERDGFHPGHELRANADFEYIFLPRDYRQPTKELFGLLEITYLHRGKAQLHGVSVAETGANVLLLAPGIQYVANPRLLLELSAQMPVRQVIGSQVPRTKVNLLAGIRFLF